MNEVHHMFYIPYDCQDGYTVISWCMGDCNGNLRYITGVI